MKKISVSLDEKTSQIIEKSGLSEQDISHIVQSSIVRHLSVPNTYYKRDVVWDLADEKLALAVSELIESYLCDVHHASHPDDPENNPWEYKTGSLDVKEYDEFNKIWENLNLKEKNKAYYKIQDGKLNTKIKISQFGIDLLLSMIDFYMDVPHKNEEVQNDLIVLRDSLDDL